MESKHSLPNKFIRGLLTPSRESEAANDEIRMSPHVCLPYPSNPLCVQEEKFAIMISFEIFIIHILASYLFYRST
jgi:hypothetical protein